MNLRSKQEFMKNSRVELLALLLNVPLVGLLLGLLYMEPEIIPVINNAGARVFGVTLDYVEILRIVSFIVAGYLLFLLIWTLARRQSVPSVFFIIPAMSLIFYLLIFMAVINGTNILSINDLLQSVDKDIGLVLYLAISAILVYICFVMIYGAPRLWNYRKLRLEGMEGESLQENGKRMKKNPAFKPKMLVIVTVIAFIASVYYMRVMLLGYSELLIWHFITASFDWDSPLVVVHVALLVFFISINATKKIPTYISSKIKGGRGDHEKIANVLSFAIMCIQALLLISLGIYLGFDVVLLNPLAFITLAELIFYLLRFKQGPFLLGPNRINEITSKFFRKHVKNKDLVRVLKVACIAGPLTWMLLYQPLVSLPPFPQLEPVSLNTVKNSYANLSVTQQAIFDGFLDDRFPPGSNASDILATDKHTRTWVRIASGLLFRNAPGDVENASYIIHKILDTQYTDPSEDRYGTFMQRIYGDSNPTDENWREFVGIELIIIVEKHGDKLDSVLNNSIKDALFMAAEGAYKRDVGAGYTNIAIMSAFLLEWVGSTMNVEKFFKTGLIKSWEIYLMFNRNGTFTEFNSPTYYGVDMVGLAAWRDLGPTESMRLMGAELEQKLWLSISKFYHAGLKNLVGPHFRGYFMDMNTSYALIGIWIALVLDDPLLAPLKHDSGYTNFDFSPIFHAVQLGHSVPESPILDEFTSFSGPRYLTRAVPNDIVLYGTNYHVSAMLDDDWMMGGVRGKTYHDSQFKTGTIYWNSSVDDSLAWLLVSGLDYLDVEVNQTHFTMSQTGRTSTLTFYINCEGIDTTMINGTTWTLPGITFETNAIMSEMRVESVSNLNGFQNTYRTGNAKVVIKLEYSLDTISLKPI